MGDRSNESDSRLSCHTIDHLLTSQYECVNGVGRFSMDVSSGVGTFCMNVSNGVG